MHLINEYNFHFDPSPFAIFPATSFHAHKMSDLYQQKTDQSIISQRYNHLPNKKKIVRL